MALQGNLRDFSGTEILQLLGSQKKTGCLILESSSGQGVVFVQDGRIIAARPPGVTKGDPLIAFLQTIRRLTEEQALGLQTLHQESHRDLEDLLVSGRYVDEQDLGGYVERQILDTLMNVMRWTQGTYRFDPNTRWETPVAVRLGMDSVLIEIARRSDEEKRYAKIFYDPHLLLTLRDLPDPDEPLSEEERDLFGLVDGRHTVGEIESEAPLTPFEARDVLNRMLEANWIEIAGRREGSAPPPPLVLEVAQPLRRRRSLLRELALALVIAAAVLGLRAGAVMLQPQPARPGMSDVFAAATLRDLRFALELYRRERGRYPLRFDTLVDDRWVGPEQARLPGYVVHYRVLQAGASYQLELVLDR